MTISDERFGYAIGTQLMKDVRELNYKGQADVIQKFYQKFGEADSILGPTIMEERFEETYSVVNFARLDDYIGPLHYLLNDFDNLIYEIDSNDSMRFYEIAEYLAPTIKKWQGKVNGLKK